MSDLKLNKSGDLDITDGDFSLITDKDEFIAQSLSIRLATVKGEWYLDITQGIPYLKEILRKGVPKSFVDDVFRNAIKNTVGVNSIVKFESSIVYNTYKLSFQFTTESGELSSLFKREIYL